MMEDLPKALQLGGGWGNVSGPGLFMIRMTTSAVISSIFMGMSGAFVGAFVWDTATLPFLFSACGGFILGATGFYRDALRKALRAIDRYPRLLQLHLDANFSHRGFETWSLRQLHSSSFRPSWQMSSMLIAAWMTASPTIEKIKEAREESLVQAYAEVSEEEE